MKILVTGCEGMLGRAVMGRLADRHDMFGVDLTDGDLTGDGVAEGIVTRVRPDWIIHCAAWTDVDGAETARDAAMAVNATATEMVGQAAARLGAGLTFISTDYVFNGREGNGYLEDSPREPVNYYGLTKARAEEIVEQLATPWQIVRTSWLFGDGKVNFIKTIRRLLAERDTLRVVSDQCGCPTYTGDLAAVLEFLVAGRHEGIFHGTNQGTTSWHGLAREVARCVGTAPERIVACPSSEYPTPATRPANSVLLSRRLEAAGCPARPRWQAAVAQYVNRLAAGDVAFP